MCQNVDRVASPNSINIRSGSIKGRTCALLSRTAESCFRAWATHHSVLSGAVPSALAVRRGASRNYKRPRNRSPSSPWQLLLAVTSEISLAYHLHIDRTRAQLAA